jgi:mannose-6-phosphate isomerase-like protein (cupin superfamily)
MHVRQNEDEHILIVEGRARIACGDKTFDATAGEAVSLPKNIPHAWGNLSNSRLRMVVTCRPWRRGGNPTIDRRGEGY